MNNIAKAFSKADYETYSWGYPSRKCTIEEHADHLVAALNTTAKKHPDESIHFVTHSLGGIILRCALNHPNCPEEAKKGRAVLLSPPNKGSSFGRFLNKIGPIRTLVGPKAGKQILTQKNFDHLGSFPEKMYVLIISGTFGWNPLIGEKNDGKVGISESCLSTAHQHITTFSGHSWIMFSSPVIYDALKFISQTDPITLCQGI